MDTKVLLSEEEKSPEIHMNLTDIQTDSAISQYYVKMSDIYKDAAMQIFPYIDAYDLSSIKAFLEKNPKLDLTKLYNIQGKTLLHSAVIKNDESIVDFLLTIAVFYMKNI